MATETAIILFGSIITIVLITVSVFFIILLKRLSRLSQEAENTLVIVNEKLPNTIDNVDQLVEHAEESLDGLDLTLKSIQEPLEKLSSLTKIGKGVLSQTAGLGSAREVGTQIGLKLATMFSQHFGKVALGAAAGGLVTLIKRLFTKKQ